MELKLLLFLRYFFGSRNGIINLLPLVGKLLLLAFVVKFHYVFSVMSKSFSFWWKYENLFQLRKISVWFLILTNFWNFPLIVKSKNEFQKKVIKLKWKASSFSYMKLQLPLTEREIKAARGKEGISFSLNYLHSIKVGN